ncbi:MAG: zf-HC2 domain-containing protein [Thermoguttaceae bacterium]|nr:zf-HC2 domain-containing protein [Thermoguttaceae bacterium]
MENNINIDWEELVDLYVDDECSADERLALEAKMKDDGSIRLAAESALRIRKGIQELRVSAPKGFAERLQLALADASEKNFVRTRSTGVTKVLRNPRVAVSAAAAVAVAVGTVGFVSYQNGSKVVPPTIETRMAESGALPNETTIKVEEQTNFVRIPSAGGQAPEAVAKRDSQEAFWTIVTVNEPQTLKKKTSSFQRCCDKLNVKFTKSGNDCEYLLQEAGTQEWKQIAGELTALGEIVESDALRNWSSQEVGETRNVRVVFKAGAQDTEAGTGETAEE